MVITMYTQEMGSLRERAVIIQIYFNTFSINSFLLIGLEI